MILRSWDYEEGVPRLPVKLIGPKLTIYYKALVDTGASYCVVHPDFIDNMGIQTLRKTGTYGFGSVDRFEIDIVGMSIGVEDVKHTVEVAKIPASKYPMTAPKVVIGRNYLKFFKVILDGIDQVLYLE